METSAQTKAKRPKVFHAMVSVLSVVLALLTLEVLVRLFYPVSFAMEYNMYFIPDPYTGFRPQPHGIGYFQHRIQANANSHGHRDDEVTLPKQAGTYRILVLGDSFTVGASVAQDEAYPQVLEELLNQQVSRPVEVANAGVGAWDPFQYAQYYEYYGQQFEPDLILIGFFVGNDTYAQIATVDELTTAIMGRRVTREAASGRFIKLKLFLYEHSHLARLAIKGPSVPLDFARDTCEDFTDLYLQIQRSRLPNHLVLGTDQYFGAQNSLDQIKRIKELAGRESIPVVVALLPDEIQINTHLQDILLEDEDPSAYNFEMPQVMLLQLFAENGLPTIDLLPHFREDPRCLYINDTHWTPAGHRLAASVILEHVNAMLDPNAQRPGVADLPLRLRLGESEARQWMGRGWHQDESLGSESWVWSDGPESVLQVPLPTDRDIEMRLEGQPFLFPNSLPQHVSVVLNGTALEQFPMSADRQRYSVVLPKEYLRDLNTLELRYAYSRRSQDVLPDSSDSRELAVSWYTIEFDVLLEFGEPETRQSMISGWHGDEASNGETWVWSSGPSSVLQGPPTGNAARARSSPHRRQNLPVQRQLDSACGGAPGGFHEGVSPNLSRSLVQHEGQEI